jgi:hypothetical protein
MSPVGRHFEKAQLTHAARNGRVAMRAQESHITPETSRRALLAALGVAISSVGQPSHAGLFEKTGMGMTTATDSNYEVDKELLATANLTQSLQYFKELKEKFVTKRDEFAKNPTTEPMKPFLIQVFRIAEIRRNANILTKAFDERTQVSMDGQIAILVDQNPGIEKFAKFKKDKESRGAKSAERVLGSLNACITELDSFLAFFPK